MVTSSLKIFVWCLFLGCIVVVNTSTAQKVSKTIRRNFDNCYTGKKTDIEKYLNINGYYELKEIIGISTSAEARRVDTFSINMLLYDDGTVLYNFYDLDHAAPGDVEGYMRRLSISGPDEMFTNSFYWGIYKVLGDTLIAQVIHNKSLLSPWSAWEHRFIIRDRDTLEYLGRRDLVNRKKSAVSLPGVFLPAVFISYPFIPPNNSWLKERSWTHCNQAF